MRRRRSSFAFAIFLLLHSAASAAEVEVEEENPASRPTVDAALEEVRTQYGTEATALQGYLLNHAIRGGSVLEASVSIAGFEQLGERRFVIYKLDTGIVYGEADAPPARQLARIWADVVEPSARKAAQTNLPADGIALWITYHRGPHADRADVQRQLQAGRIVAVETRFYIGTRDTMELLADHITSQELAARSEVRVDGQPARVDLSVLTAGEEVP